MIISMKAKFFLRQMMSTILTRRKFKVPFVCGAKDLGEALRRINEGASMIRTKGRAWNR